MLSVVYKNREEGGLINTTAYRCTPLNDFNGSPDINTH
jgi:hypothetical protein